MVSELWNKAYEAREIEVKAIEALEALRDKMDARSMANARPMLHEKMGFEVLHIAAEAASKARELAFLAAHRADPKFFEAKAGK